MTEVGRAPGAKGANNQAQSLDAIRPPTISAATGLPFLDLDWERFECLCRDLVWAEKFSQVHRYGKRGQRQHGIDFHGISPDGNRFAFQVRNVAKMTAAELKGAVSNFASGPIPNQYNNFVVCLSVEGNEAHFQDELERQRKQREFGIEVWDSPALTHQLRRHRNLIHTYFGRNWVETFFGPTSPSDRDLDSEALLLGPVEVLGLTSLVERGQELSESSPSEAAGVFKTIADKLRERFPQHAARFDQFRAAALANAGDWDTSHDLLMVLAVRDLFQKAQPQVSSGVAYWIRSTHDSVDDIRKARGSSFLAFGDSHEQVQRLADIGECFDSIPSNDIYAPHIAVLMVESGLVHNKLQLIRDNKEKLLHVAEAGNEQMSIRIRAALADASEQDDWQGLIEAAMSLKYPGPMGSFVCRRAARWCAWQGNVDRAETLYRLSIKLGAESNLDRDVEDALWSLTSLYTLPGRIEDLGATNRLALDINGSFSFVPMNTRTRARAYRHFAHEKIPDAHLWSRFWLLEAIRNGSLLDEIDAHSLLARVFHQANETVAALEHAVLGGKTDLVKEIAPATGSWPSFASVALQNQAPWTLKPILSIIQYLGDIAPPPIAREFANALVNRIRSDGLRSDATRSLLDALIAVVLEADTELTHQLIPLLLTAAKRNPEEFRLSDSGVAMIAARLYRFRPDFRKTAASILGEIAIGRHTIHWIHALNECGDDKRDLVGAFQKVADREGVTLVGPLSDLEHATPETQELWMKRLGYVDAYRIGPRANYQLQVRFDVPTDFLEQQESERANQYVRKLVAIALDAHEPTANRANALTCAAAGVELLPRSERAELFGMTRPLTQYNIPVSQLDQIQADSMHALNRFRISLGHTSELRGAAGLFLVRAATKRAEHSMVQSMSRAWVRSDDLSLQHFGVTLLTDFFDSIEPEVGMELLAHPNPRVRRIALSAQVIGALPRVDFVETFADDGDIGVRIALARALTAIKVLSADSYERIRGQLAGDVSGLVRAIASEN